MQKRKTIGLAVAAGWVLPGVLAFPAGAAAQALSPCAGPQAGRIPACPVVREIDDPSTGQHWVLMRDPAHPGGPGALMPEGAVSGGGLLEGATVHLRPVIRAGDRLTVEESNARAELRLEGIALSSAAPGAQLRVRLVLSGKVVEAVALGSGRAVRSPEKELWP